MVSLSVSENGNFWVFSWNIAVVYKTTSLQQQKILNKTKNGRNLQGFYTQHVKYCEKSYFWLRLLFDIGSAHFLKRNHDLQFQREYSELQQSS